MGEVLLASLAALILCIVTIYQSYQKYLSDKVAEEERHKAEMERQNAEQARRDANYHQAKAIEYLDELNKKNIEIQNLQKSNLQKSEKIIHGLDETLRHVIGEGVPVIEVAGSKIDSYVINFHNSSNYPLYDLQVEQINLTELAKHPLEKVNGEFFINDSILESIVNIYVSQVVLPAKKKLRIPIKLPKTESTDFVLYKITTRHATFMQYCSILNLPAINRIYYKYITFQVVGGEYRKVLSNFNVEKEKEFYKNCPFYKKKLISFVTE